MVWAKELKTSAINHQYKSGKKSNPPIQKLFSVLFLCIRNVFGFTCRTGSITGTCADKPEHQ
jgi:hypothetical protein